MKLTNSAIKKISQLKEEEENEQLLLRVYIVGGGCAGFQYGFSFAESPNDGDQVFEGGMVIDPLSMQYLNGSVIDYVKDFHGERFVVNNPNANTTCGCGSSFSV